MISCNHYDYIEIACMHRLNIELVLKNGDSVCGVAADIKRNALKQECIESPRVCQRLNNLRNWNYEKIKSLYIRIS